MDLDESYPLDHLRPYLGSQSEIALRQIVSLLPLVCAMEIGRRGEIKLKHVPALYRPNTQATLVVSPMMMINDDSQ